MSFLKERETMENRFFRLFNMELFKRLISVIFFIPLMILPIFYSNYLLVLVYLFLNTIVLNELVKMKSSQTSVSLINLYIPITVFSFFIFIILIITDPFLKFIIIEILITIWLFDTFSFLGGKLIGGRKLIPTISKGKTISGLMTGIIFTLLIVHNFKILNDEYEHIYLSYSLIIMLFAFLGDTIASILKRVSSVKDSGVIMPGHGGLFDRLDSFIFVFFAFGIIMFFG